MVRTMVQKLPVMITPRWVRTLAQPISIEDVIAYLIAALDLPLHESRVYEIGGADRVSYEGIMREYAYIRGLRRLIIPVPLLTPHLSGLWLTLVTPLYAIIGRHLIEGVRNETTVQDERALADFSIRPMGVRRALERAVANEDREYAATHWSDALGPAVAQTHWGGVKFGSRIVLPLQAWVGLPPGQAFGLIRCLGGSHGWHRYTFLWKLRGMIDQLLGGVGLRRGRPRPGCLDRGDVVDFWRVEKVEAPRMLRLAAEMKLPGRAWLQFDIEPLNRGSLITQTAIFDPIGLPGLLYWYAIYPLHMLVFRALLRGITRAAQTRAENPLVQSPP
jgi:hypothetical protein